MARLSSEMLNDLKKTSVWVLQNWLTDLLSQVSTPWTKQNLATEMWETQTQYIYSIYTHMKTP